MDNPNKRDLSYLSTSLFLRGLQCPKSLYLYKTRSDKAMLGTWIKAKTPDTGIEKSLAEAGIGYISLIDLGNIFGEYDDWETRAKPFWANPGTSWLKG